MASGRPIPAGVIAVVAEELGGFFSHTKLNNLFPIAGAVGDVPMGNKIDKCSSWLLHTNKQHQDPCEVLAGVIGEYMEADAGGPDDPRIKGRERITKILAKNGLSYAEGQILGGTRVAGPTRTLESMLRERDLPSVEKEFTRALEHVEKAPDTAVTAACAIIEAFCRIYIEDNGLTMPAKQDLGGLWKEVRKDLRLDGLEVADDDVRKILSGLGSIADGVAAFRTHAGSAHGKGRKPFNLEPRHARLAVHSAQTLVVYLVERAEYVKK